MGWILAIIYIRNIYFESNDSFQITQTMDDMLKEIETDDFRVIGGRDDLFLTHSRTLPDDLFSDHFQPIFQWTNTDSDHYQITYYDQSDAKFHQNLSKGSQSKVPE